MDRLIDSMAEYLAHHASPGCLPEHREIKLHGNTAGIQFLGDDCGVPANQVVPGLMNSVAAFMLLDAFLEAENPALEGKTTWERYQAISTKCRTGRLTSQVYRILRVLRIAFLRPGIIEYSRGYIRAAWTGNGTAYTLIITRSGLSLLEAFVACYLNSFRLPYGEAYVEALLSEYYADISSEVKKFQDEDAEIMRFRKAMEFNRHFRLDCGTPGFTVTEDRLLFELPGVFLDSSKYPIDLFTVVDGVLYVIPVEALTQKELPLAELAKWRAREINCKVASPQLHLEFGFENLSNGGPMS